MSAIENVGVASRTADTQSDNPLYRTLRHFWHPVAYSSELQDKPLAVTLLGERIAVARFKGRIGALPDRCAHKGTALSLGAIVDGTLECPYHGWRYEADGACVRIPAREDLTDVIKARVGCYHAIEAAGIVWVALEEPLFPPPVFPEFEDPAYRVSQGPTYDWRTSAPRRLENFVDFSHFAFVHDGSIGSRANPRVDAVKVWREDHVLRFDRSGVKEPGVGLKKELLGLTDEWIEPVNEYHVTMPHTVHLKRTFPNNQHYVLFMSACPIGPDHTRSFWWQARDFGTDQKYDKFFMDFEAEVLAQDKPVIESQTPALFRLDGSDPHAREIPVRGADIVTIEYRRWLLDLVNQVSR